jgi:hypothetical protein
MATTEEGSRIVRKFSTEEEYLEYVEEQSLKFRESYGLRPEDPLTDEVLAQALEDYGFPMLEELHDSPVIYSSDPIPPREAPKPGTGRRERAAHLIAHGILHNCERCGLCREW